MHFSPSFVLAALPFLGLASAAVAPAADKIHIDIAKRSNLKKASGAVNIAALKAHVASSTAKIHNGFNAFEANTGKAHPLSSEKSRAAKRKVGSDPLTDAQEELWYGAISVGTPAVKFTVDFDTGSSDLFLPSSSCSNCGSHTTYNPSRSSTAKSKGKSFSLSYGDGSTVSGTQYTDTVTLASLTAKTQTLGSARTYSSSFQSGPSDGLLGMGFQSISEYNSPPVFQSLVNAGATSSPVFAFKLADSGSSLTVGGVNSNLYQGDFTYVPVTQEGYWQVAFDSVNVDGQEAIGSLGAIIDSGTTLIVGDTQNVDAFYQSVQGAQQASDLGDGYYTFPCDSPPNTSITFGGQEFSIDPSTFNLGPAEDGSDQCVGGIVGEDLGESFWIVGDVFMRNVYTVFDYGNSQVGFANLA